MKFSDLFVPKYVHSDPEVRMNFISKCSDIQLLKQMSVKDKDDLVRQAARDRVMVLSPEQQVS